MQSHSPRLALTGAERRASISLAGLFAARMLGLFLLLPVFAVAAQSLEGGMDPAKVGLALGIYGLTQAVMQIPFGMASDRFGRRPVVLTGLTLFVAGSVICALSDDIFWVTIGRAIQGSGAISAAVTAWLADATRPEVRTRAMAMIGASIGLSFALSLVIAPLTVGWGGLSGLFWLITGLGVVAFVVAAFVVPAVARTPKPENPTKSKVVLKHPGLLRLNFGVFCLHLSQVALFVVMPPLLVKLGGIQTDALWQVYLPVLFISFLFMVPIIIFTEKRRAHPKTLRWAVAGLVAVGLGFALTGTNWIWLLFWLTVFFIAFNVLEALQPSLVSRVAPPELKGLALGVYNTTQATGLFLGGAVGGWLVQSAGNESVFWVIAALSAIWLAVTWKLTMPSMDTGLSEPRTPTAVNTAA
ncbi:MAG: MFS transporter [Burkholderiaceae bacterium]|nr:MFS transporter [Burkholderiaceae bacterium]MCD8517256.1 MFS transporter [Burkholderiaceae bacterium]MCD8564886.1 MFS transporter [Burkholderiaceae bacterium]